MPARKSVGMDKFPNFMSGQITLSAANTFTTQQVFTPIPRLKTSGNKATVMELLWIDLQWDGTDLIDVGDVVSGSMNTGVPPTATTDLSDPRTLVVSRWEMGLTTSGASLFKQPERHEMQSLDGYGTLLASDSFHVAATSVTQAAAVILNWRIYYRFVEITVAEFVGLVQSTQQS